MRRRPLKYSGLAGLQAGISLEALTDVAIAVSETEGSGQIGCELSEFRLAGSLEVRRTGAGGISITARQMGHLCRVVSGELRFAFTSLQTQSRWNHAPQQPGEYSGFPPLCSTASRHIGQSSDVVMQARKVKTILSRSLQESLLT
jgi:hypothetical protein